MYVGSLVEAISGNSNYRPGSIAAKMRPFDQAAMKKDPNLSITHRVVKPSQIPVELHAKLGIK